MQVSKSEAVRLSIFHRTYMHTYFTLFPIPTILKPSTELSSYVEKKAGRKHPDPLADSCKLSSVNRMAAGLRLSRYNHGFFFSFLHLFQTCFSVNIFEQAVEFSVLQTFSLLCCKSW